MENNTNKVADISIILPGEGEFPSWEDCEEYQPIDILVTIDETDDFPY